MKMQDTSHRAGDYSRPNLNWQCGREECCQLGPTVDGKCADAETPCVPRRSVKSRKRIAAISLFCVFVGVLGVFLSASALLPNVSPGPLSVSHAEVAECQTCHVGVESEVGGWAEKALLRILAIDKADQHQDDKQCLTCHGLGENAFLAHSTVQSNLNGSSDVTQSLESSSPKLNLLMASMLHDLQMDDQDQISCSTCHQQHIGEHNPRVDFEPDKCHTCHEVKFDELGAGHPEYSKFPYSQPTHINYDHSNHRGKYFLDDKYSDRAPQTCQHCHEPDQTGEWMLLNSFDDTCSTCHLDDVLGMDRTSAKGIAVLSIPKLDAKTLIQAGFNIGEWPSWADGELTPFMCALLPPSFKNSRLLESNALHDLSKASPQELQTAALLAWEIKLLFSELLVSGTVALDQRLSSALGQRLDLSTMNRLIAALPKDTLVNNQREWFPNLMQEVADYRTGKIRFRLDSKKSEDTNPEVSQFGQEHTQGRDVRNPNSEAVNGDQALDLTTGQNTKPAEEWAVSGGWYRDGSSILYRPKDHSDLFFKTWLDLSAAQYDMLDGALFKSLSADKSVGNCTNCHTIQTNMANGQQENTGADAGSTKSPPKIQSELPRYQMNWLSFRPSDVHLDFNRFSHSSHFNQECVSCHIVSSEPAVDLKKRNRSPAENVSLTGFLNIEKSNCTECHQEGRASDSCLACHNYHAELRGNWVDKASDMPESQE